VTRNDWGSPGEIRARYPLPSEHGVRRRSHVRGFPCTAFSTQRRLRAVSRTDDFVRVRLAGRVIFGGSLAGKVSRSCRSSSSSSSRFSRCSDVSYSFGIYQSPRSAGDWPSFARELRWQMHIVPPKSERN